MTGVRELAPVSRKEPASSSGYVHDVSADSKDLIGIEASTPLAMQGLQQPGRWSLYGAALGTSATAAVTLVPAMITTSASVAVLLLSGTVSSAVVGAYMGRRWHRLVSRERATMPVGRLITRFAGHGAVWGAAAAVGTILPLAFTPVSLGWLLGAMSLAAVVGGTAGAITTGLLGVSHVLDLTRGERPWKSLALALIIGPSALFTVMIIVKVFAFLIGIG